MPYGRTLDLLPQSPMDRQAPLNAGLVAWWLALPPNRDGGIRWYDLVRGYAAVLTTPASGDGWVPSPPRPGSLSRESPFFQASATNDGHFVGPAFATLTGREAISFSAWVYCTGTPSTAGRIISSSDVSAFGLDITATTTVRVVVGGSALSATVSSIQGAWVHLAGTWVRSTSQLAYLNGKQVASGSIYGSALPTAVAVAIGNRTSGDREFPGWIDDVRIWDRALSAAEILGVYNDSIESYPSTLWRPNRRIFSPTGASSGSGAVTLGSIVVAGAGAFSTPASGAITLGAIATAGAGSFSTPASGAITLGAIAVAGAGTAAGATATGSGAITLGSITVAGAGTAAGGTATGSGAITLGSIVVVGVGIGAELVEYPDPFRATSTVVANQANPWAAASRLKGS